MQRMSYKSLVAEAAPFVEEAFPWEVPWLPELGAPGEDWLFLDVRCPSEFDRMHIQGALNVPRGILETACDWGFEETEPELVEARGRPVLVLCRSGNRSILAARTLQRMGYRRALSLKTGLRGWNDYELPLIDAGDRIVPPDEADLYFNPRIDPAKLGPRPAQPGAIA
jgi:rhodanese-related sulfurtransferase